MSKIDIVTPGGSTPVQARSAAVLKESFLRLPEIPRMWMIAPCQSGNFARGMASNFAPTGACLQQATPIPTDGGDDGAG